MSNGHILTIARRHQPRNSFTKADFSLNAQLQSDIKRSHHIRCSFEVYYQRQESKSLKIINQEKHRRSAHNAILIQLLLKASTLKGSLVQNTLDISLDESFVRKIPLLALRVLKGKGQKLKVKRKLCEGFRLSFY